MRVNGSFKDSGDLRVESVVFAQRFAFMLATVRKRPQPFARAPEHVAGYFCDVFRRCVAVFVAGAALWTCLSSFCVAGAALWRSRVVCFLRIALSGLCQVATRCNLRTRRGIL